MDELEQLLEFADGLAPETARQALKHALSNLGAEASHGPVDWATITSFVRFALTDHSGESGTQPPKPPTA